MLLIAENKTKYFLKLCLPQSIVWETTFRKTVLKFVTMSPYMIELENILSQIKSVK